MITDGNRVRTTVFAARAWSLGTIALTVGAFAVTIMLAPGAGERPVRALQWLLFLGSSVHVGATAWFYTVPEVRRHMLAHRIRYVFVPCGLIAGASAFAGLVPENAFILPLLGFFAWQFFHFQKQNLGMAALAGAAHGSVTRAERRAIIAAGVAGIVGVVANPALVGLDAPASGWLRMVAAIGFAGSAVTGIVLVRKRNPAFGVVYVISLLFFAPVFVFDSPYRAIAGMTLAHGAQYLLIVGLVAGARLPGRSPWISLGVLLNLALIIGLGLNLASHQHSAPFPGRMVFGAFLGASMAHFVIDAGLWRLRDEFPRAFLRERLPYLLVQPPPQERSPLAPGAR